MAGDWIKMRVDLQSHPKIVRILSATKADKFRAIGGLHAVWSVFDTHSVDGFLAGYSPELMDHVIGWPGFSEAMIAVGWLLWDGKETLSMPEFTEHNGKSGKRRAEDQKRKREGRKSPQSVRIESANDADKNRTREEKRREEVKEKEPDLLAGVDKQIAKDFLRIRKAKRLPLTQTAVDGIKREADKAGYTFEQAIKVCCEKGWASFDSSWSGAKPAHSRPGMTGDSPASRRALT